MASILDARGCVELASCIVDGFVDARDFDMFVSGNLNESFLTQVPSDREFTIQANTFVSAKNKRGRSGELLDHLGEYWKKRDDLIRRIRPLVEHLNSDGPDKSWFLSYAGMEEDWADRLQSNAVFEDAFEDRLQRPTSGNADGRIGEGLRDEINQSEYFVALLGRYYVTSSICSRIFAAAFEGWRNRLSGEKAARQKLIVLVLDDKGEEWWTEKYLNTIPPDGCAYWTKFRVGDDFASLRKSLADWVKSPPAAPAWPQASSVIVLGEPTGHPTEAISTAVDDLVSYLVTRAADRVDFWEDGWSKRARMSDAERAQTFARTPIFVRAISDRAATIRETQTALKPHLLNAFGFEFSDEANWLTELSRLRRIYWRPDGPDWTSEGVELGWTGQAQDFGARLAELAGFPGRTSRRMIVRYEDPKSLDPAQTQLNRQLVVSSLQSAAQAGAGRDMVPNTVPISFEKIEDSIKKFTKNGLNVIALHDLEAQRDDTIRRFEGADKRIDSAVNRLFGGAQKPPILRVAVLLRNAGSFEGLRFDHDSSVHRWNLLKRTDASDGTLKFDEQGFRNIAREARDLLADVP